MTRNVLLLLLVCMSALGITAKTMEEAATLVVNLNDGNIYRFNIPAKAPSLQFYRSYVNVSYTDEDGNEVSELKIERDNLKGVYFEYTETGIQSAQSEKHAVTFNLQQPDMIAVNGLSTDDKILVSGIDGRNVMNVKASTDGQTIVDLTGYTRGIYIISVNKQFTFKYMKP